MIPGFTATDTQPPVKLAWLWDDPGGGGKTCRPARTDTFCTGLVLWCTDVFICTDKRGTGGPFGFEESRPPYPCGVCVGITSPDDW